MVQVINQSVCGGIAVRRLNVTPKGVVIHNDAGSIYATVVQYVNALTVMFPTQLANEQLTFKQVAEDMKFWGMQPNREAVRLHKEFVPTACPHR